MRAKKLKEAATQSKKRSLADDAGDRPQKRVRTNASRTRTAPNSRPASSKLDTAIAEHSATPISEEGEAPSVVQKGRKLEVPISQFGRSGRTIRLPTRFR